MLHCVLLKYQEKAVEKEATAKKVAQAAAAKKTKQTVKYEDLEMMRVLGAGTFGKVSLVRHRPVRLTKAPGCSVVHYHPSSFSLLPRSPSLSFSFSFSFSGVTLSLLQTNTPYALKVLQKAKVVAFKQTKNVMNEKNVMAQVDHPFILKLVAT